MDKDNKVILGILIAFLTLIFALCVFAAMDKQAYRLALTNEGCVFAQSIGLSVEKSKGQCSVDANFQPFSISSGGLMFLNDDTTVQVTDSMLLATAQLDKKLPLTPTQQIQLKGFYFLLCLAIAIVLYTVFIKFFSKK